MAYNNYFPQQYYPQFYGSQQMQQNTPQVAQAPQQTSSGNLIWVQGEAAAKAYPVVAGQSVFLMDSEESVFYIKATDQSGMPQPLRIFDYKERTTAQNSPVSAPKASNEYVSRKEFEAFRDDVRKEISGIRVEEGEG